MDRILTLAVAVCVSSAAFSNALAANLARGRDLFSQKCSVCHTAEKDGGNRIGPNLFAVVGRPSGSVPGFSYSSAMKNARLVWTADKLATYLAGPQKMLPGIRMTFAGFGNPSDAEDVIAYLSSLTATHHAAE